MKITVEVEIELDGEELAQELCKLDPWLQAEFLHDLAFQYKVHTKKFLEKLSGVADEVSKDEDVIHMLEKVVQYIKEGEE